MMVRILNLLIALIALFVSGVAHSNDDMSLIPGGTFYMGQEGIQDDESPVHPVSLPGFKIDRFEVPIWLWKKIADWAVQNGYEFNINTQYYKAGPFWYKLSSSENFPMNMVNWYDAVKWCNARSEYMGRTPAYYISSSMQEVYRKGEIHLAESMVDWQSSGYRLPSEEEWEKAARGGVFGKNYPWGNSVDGSKSNYKKSGDPFDDASSPIGYYDGNQKISSALNSIQGENTSPADYSNNYGVHDLIGNVSEWCWDWYDEKWYRKKNSSTMNTKGPAFSYDESVGQYKVHRGGGFKDGPSMDEGKPLRIAFRHVQYPEESRRAIGFRTVRSIHEDSLWKDAKLYGDFAKNWHVSEWFGSYYQSSFTWIFHNDFGWIYPVGMGSYNNWIYFPSAGWLWTARFAYPFFFHSGEDSWYKYLIAHKESGWFESQLSGHRVRWGR